jgi:hypothetical protein
MPVKNRKKIRQVRYLIYVSNLHRCTQGGGGGEGGGRHLMYPL